MPDVEIHWPDRVDTAPLLEAAAFLEESGVAMECLVQPVRRGLPMEALVFVASPALEPFLKAVFEKVGGDAYAAVRRLVRTLLGGARRTERAGPVPTAVVFESTETGAQFVFTDGLPERAFRAAVEMDPGGITAGRRGLGAPRGPLAPFSQENTPPPGGKRQFEQAP